MSSPVRSDNPTRSDLHPTRMGAGLLTGLAREADRRGDRRLRSVYVAALGGLAALHVERLRKRLP